MTGRSKATGLTPPIDVPNQSQRFWMPCKCLKEKILSIFHLYTMHTVYNCMYMTPRSSKCLRMFTECGGLPINFQTICEEARQTKVCDVTPEGKEAFKKDLELQNFLEVVRKDAHSFHLLASQTTWKAFLRFFFYQWLD